MVSRIGDMTRKTAAGLILAVLLPLIVVLYPADIGAVPRMALALSLATVVLWTFEPVPLEYSSLLMIVLFPVLGVLTFETAFGPFSSKTVWLIFAGMALSLGITETPLGSRLSRLVLGHIRSLNGLILALHVLGMLSALLIPSGVVRILILMPLIITLLRTLGEPPGSRVSVALILSLVCSTYYGGTGVLTASVPSLVVFGVLESRDISVYWGQWALYLFPVFSLCRVACCYGLIRLLLPLGRESGFQIALDDAGDIPDRVTPAEKKTLCILLAGVLLWATDAIHGIHPAYVGLGLVLFCYLPGLGPLHPDLLKKINFPLLIYIAAAFSVGHALETTGFSPLLANLFTEWLSRVDDSLLVQLGLLSAFILPFNFLADTAAVAAILTPVLLDVAAQTGMAPLPAALCMAIVASCGFFPYQAAPFILAYSFRYVHMGQFIRLMVLLALVSLLVLIPLNFLYWRLLRLI